MNSKKRIAAYVLSMLALSAVSGVAGAAPWDDAGQGVQDAMYGPIGTTLAVLGVAGVGIAAFFGKLAWERAGMVVGGIVIFFAAPAIVSYVKTKMNTTTGFDTTSQAIYALADVKVPKLPKGIA